MASNPRLELSPADNPAVIAHIGLLQSIIGRLSTSSASCKTWCVTLVGAFFSFAALMKIPDILCFTVMPVIAFASLDTLYLTHERAYRKLYQEVVHLVRNGTYGRDVVYSATICPSRMDFAKTAYSWSVVPFYTGMLGVSLAVVAII
jgi:hypothetical protein